MKIRVRVKPNARQEGVTRVEDGSYLARVGAAPVEGRANERLIELMAAYFEKPKRDIRIVAGIRSKHKLVEIL